MDHGTRIVPVVGARSAVSRKNVETASSGRLIPSIGGTFCITHSRPRPVQELPTMCGGCGKIAEAVRTDVSASCWRSNVSFSQARSSIGILPILENVLFVSLCRRMHSRIAWYVSEVNSVYQGLFQSVAISAILSVGNQLV